MPVSPWLYILTQELKTQLEAVQEKEDPLKHLISECSIFNASSTLCGNQIPNLCVVVQYFDLVLEMMRLRFFTTYGIHQANAGFLSMPR